MKKYLMFILLLITVLSSTLANPTPNKITLQITGPNPAWEGSVCKYTVTNSVPPGAIFAQPTVTNGTLVSYNLTSTGNNPMSVTVKWDCQPVNAVGSITVTELVTNSGYTHNVDLLTYSTVPNFCNQTLPEEQNVLYGVNPQILEVPDCSPHCTSSYGFTYQWQRATAIDNSSISPIVTAWEDITGATMLTYQPPAMTNYGTTAYRRITIFVDNGHIVEIASSPAWLTFNTYLAAGSIATPTTTITNILPVITQEPASGGLCFPTNYSYTWESSINGGIWQVIGTGEAYPSTAPYIYGPVRIRRKVVCQSEMQYSNIIDLAFSQITLNPGSISYGSLVLTNIMNPSIDQTAATGGICPTGGYTYSWERSVQGGNWEIIGTTESYPATAPPVITTTVIRRKAICQNETGYSNSLTFTIDNANYNPVFTDNLNYVRETVIARPGIIFRPQIEALPVEEKAQTTTFFDGTGRTVQTVSKQSSSLKKDVVAFNEYDYMGREAKKHLSFVSSVAQMGDVDNDGRFKASFVQQQINFNQQQYGAQGENVFYGLTEYEASPLGRPLKVFAPGNSWMGSQGSSNEKAVKQQYLTNTVADGVIIWEIASTTGSLPQQVGAYAAGQLYKSVSINEHGKTIVEYKDKSGKVLLKKVQHLDAAGDGHNGWLCTYYIYNGLGALAFTIPPLAVEKYLAGTSLATLADELCFSYIYDKRGRTIMKKVPGAAVVNMVYDARDRLIMSQDGNLLAQGKWKVIQYDAQNRAVKTLLWQNSNNATYHAAQAANSTSYPNVQAGMTEANSELLVETYYDNYDWVASSGTTLSTTMDAGLFNNSSYFITSTNVSPFYAQPMVTTKFTQGLTTGVKTKVLGTTNQYLYAVNFYDERGNLLQAQSINASGGKDISSTQYDFTGKLLRAVQQHQKTASGTDMVTIATKFAYNHVGSILSVKKSITSNINGVVVNSPEKTLAQYIYDEMGQLKKKEIGKENGGTNPLETLEYDYNIRGWLTGINKNWLNNNATTGATNWFAMELAYDKTSSATSANYAGSLYNGNIAGVTWKQKGDGVRRRYNYGYDNVNRFLKADFTQNESGTTWNATNMNYSVAMGDGTNSASAYDANGNIQQMQQWGWKMGGSVQMDNLMYHYGTTAAPYSNKLTKVVETASGSTPPGNAPGLGDFKDGTNTGDDYSYDANGNMVLDNNKTIQELQYNYLNLPQLITVAPVQVGQSANTIAYTYDAGGNKLKKIVTDNSVTPAKVTTTEYINGFVYENDALQFTGHEEGRLRYTEQFYSNGTSQWTWQYDYYIKDHLGNVRTVLTEQQDLAKYMATFETANTAAETALFTNIAQTAYNISIIQNPSYPTDPTTNPNALASKLDGEVRQLGATLALKVMAGDKVDIGVKAWVPYSAPYAPDPRGKPVTPTPLLSSLINALTNGAGSLSGGKVTPLELNVTGGPMLQGINNFLDSHNDNVNLPPPSPKGYLNWILFDEQFKYVPAGSGFMRVGDYDDSQLQTLAQTGLPIVKSGYLFVYVSNEGTGQGENQLVFFDNLIVQHHTGPLTEEANYYPFGLVQKGISSKAALRLKTKFGYQGDNSMYDEEAGYNEFFLRTYDPQIARWIQLDPYMEEPGMYNGMANNPISLTDPDGGSTTDWGSRLLKDGSREYLWFGGAPPEGWENHGTYVPTFKTMNNGLYATLIDRGMIIWSANASGLLDPIGRTFNESVSQQTALLGMLRPNYAEAALVNLQSPPPPENDFLSKIKPSQDGMVPIDNYYWINRASSNPDNIGYGVMYSAANSFHNGMESFRNGDVLEGIMLMGASGSELSGLAAGRSKGKGSIWTSTKNRSSVENAFGHFKKHGIEFPEFYNAKQYVEGAKNFLHNSPAGTLMKIRTNGDVLKYHPGTNTFGVMDASGVPRTMFRPTEALNYWLKQ